MINFGTVKPGTTLIIPFHTFSSDDPSASITITGLATTDIEVYKDGGNTTRASDTGYALLGTNGIDEYGTGVHGFSVDLSSNAVDDFYENGSQYFVVIASITVDGATVNFIAATWDIGYQGALLNTVIATRTDATNFVLEEGSADDDAYNGCIVYIHDQASAVQFEIGVCDDYTGGTLSLSLLADPGIFVTVAGDNISLMPPANSTWIAATAQTAGDIPSRLVVLDAELTVISDQVVVVDQDTSDIKALLTPEISDIHSRLVVMDAELTVISDDVVLVKSDTSDTLSRLVVMDAELTVISDQVVVVDQDTSDIKALLTPEISDIHSRLVVLDAELTVISDDVVLVKSDTSDTLSRLVVMDAELTVISDQVVVVDQDTSDIKALLTPEISDIHSRLVVMDAELTVISDDVVLVKSDTSDTLSRLVVMDAELTVISDQIAIVKSDTLLWETTTTEPSGVPAVTETPHDKLAWLYMALRNKLTVTSGKKTFFDDGGGAEWEKDLSDDATTYEETKGNAI